MSIWTKIGCWCYRGELEECVSGNRPRPGTGSQLDVHLRDCTACREALDDALLASELLRYADAPAMETFNAFPTRVMASIREEISRRAAPDVIWRPLEMLGSRFAVGAAAVLLMSSIYLAEFAPPFHPVAVTSQTEVSAPPVMPEPPAQPSNADEVLVSLAGEGQ
jgi:hypothetical protein